MTELATPMIEERLLDILGREGLMLGADEMAPFLVDHRELYHGRALAVALPGCAEEVSRLLAFCNAERIGVVPQGGNTGYCGGATPDESGREIVLALRRLERAFARSTHSTIRSWPRRAALCTPCVRRRMTPRDSFL